MAKFLLLYSGGDMPATEAEQAAVLKAWTDWFTQLGSALIDPGNPFTPAAKTVKRGGAVSDGPYGGMASGYSIIQADSLEKAASLAKGCPVLLGNAVISVFETFNVM